MKTIGFLLNSFQIYLYNLIRIKIERRFFLEKEYIVSIDMGGTKTLAAVLNSRDGIIASVKKATKIGFAQKVYVKDLAGMINDVISKAKVKPESIKAVCIGVPGSINPLTGVVGFAPNLGIRNFAIKKKLQEKINYPVLIENDVNLGALGVKKFGVAKNSKNALAVFVGTGIGGAIIIDGKIYRGSNFVAGEIGHINVEKNGPVCGCGRKGCFEAVASRSAIVKKIKKDMKANKKTVLNKLVPAGKSIKSRALAEAVKANDKLVTKHLSNACEVIGRVLASISNLMNFDMIILGGGLVEALDHFMVANIKKSFEKYILKDSSKGLRIVASKLGDDAALYGGVALAEEFLNLKI